MSGQRRDEDGARPGKPSESGGAAGTPPTAAERRAQALRDNLRRRKAQARARKSVPCAESAPEN